MASILDNPAVRQAALPVTVDQYHCMGDAGLIRKNTELLSGVIVEKMNKSPNHSWIVQFLMECLRTAVPSGTHLRQEQPLTFDDSEPEPDIALVVGSRDDYRQAHPATALLVIEVAVSSAAVDREKARIYAAAGVGEYLIVLPDEKCVEIYTQPAAGRYASRQTVSESQIELSSLPGISLGLDRLFVRQQS
jgi:Uma2 family endonuclease